MFKLQFQHITAHKRNCSFYMHKHNYWKVIKDDGYSFSSERIFKIPFFKNEATIYLSEEDQEDELSDKQLDEYAQTFQSWFSSIEQHINTIKEESFKRYIKYYAHYYEDSKKSGAEPLNIDTADKHFQYIKDILHIKITNNKTLRIVFSYRRIDPEHGLEIKFIDNKFSKIGGIAET